MIVKVTYEFESEAEAIAFLQGGEAQPATTPAAGRGRPRKAAAEPAAAPAANAAAPAATAAQVAAATAPVIAMNVVADALCNLADLGGEYHDKAKAILAEFGATSLGKQPNNPASVPLDPKFYAAAVEKFKAAMPGPKAAASLI